MTQERAPDAFEAVIANRDEVMAGHLYSVYKHEDIDTIVAAVGVQHLTGILDLLSSPSDIPDKLIKSPPICDYRLFPRDSPYSQA